MPISIPRCLIAATVLLVAGPACADLGFPDYVKFPAQIQPNPEQALVHEDLAEVEFESTASGAPLVAQRGRHFQRWFLYQPAAGEPAPGYYNGTEERIWKAVGAKLSASGWQTVYLSEGRDTASWHRSADGAEAWLRMTMDAPQAQVRFEMIESAVSSNKLRHPAPGSRPAQFGDNEPIPYLAPYPGATANGGGRAAGPLDVSIAFASAGEPMLVGNSVVSRDYQGPATLSGLQFISDNREALAAAGWTILYPQDAREDSGQLIAHYTGQGRDIWARLSYQHGATLSYQVVDLGAEDWAAQLDRDCRLPLNGVHFDINKATLRPESDGILTKAAALLKARPKLAVEIQGHTDDVGSDADNLKLSAARAASVRAWLVQHGVDALRLTTNGYGERQPIADNGSDSGRARNRRVELVNTGCKPPAD